MAVRKAISSLILPYPLITPFMTDTVISSLLNNFRSQRSPTICPRSIDRWPNWAYSQSMMKSSLTPSVKRGDPSRGFVATRTLRHKIDEEQFAIIKVINGLTYFPVQKSPCTSPQYSSSSVGGFSKSYTMASRMFSNVALWPYKSSG